MLKRDENENEDEDDEAESKADEGDDRASFRLVVTRSGDSGQITWMKSRMRTNGEGYDISSNR